MAAATSSFTISCDLYTKASAGAGWTLTSGAVATLNTTASADLGVNGKGIFADTTSPVTVKPGERVVMAVTSVATAGATGFAFIEYRDLPFQGRGRPTTVPGDGTPSGLIDNMTEV